MIDYGVGVTATATITLARVDRDYFDIEDPSGS